MSATRMTNATNLKPPANVEAFRHTAADTMELVGNTPIVHLGRISPENGAAIYAKLEFLNPGGSIKDRAALGLILDAEQRGVLQPGGTVVEATAGNTGVGLAFIGVRRGYKVSLFVPEGFAEEKCILMRGFGATVERTPEDEGMQGAIRRALDFARSIPGAWMARQFDNPANPDFHFRTTAQEILDQMVAMANVPVSIRYDASRGRPAEQRRVAGSFRKLNAATGWRPTRDLATTLRAIVDDWRAR